MKTETGRGRIRCSVVFLAALILQTSTHAAEVSTWPGWRGPGRDGHVSGTWPGQKLTDRLHKAWRVELGKSYSGPVVSKTHVFVTESADGREVVRALNRGTGKEVWQHSWEGKMSVPFFARANGSWIRSTPAYDGERLYVAGMRDVLVCMDVKDGKELWRADLAKRHQSALPAFGFVCSPLVHGDHIYVQAGAAFLKLDKRSGKGVWRALADKGGMYGGAFSSPIVATLHGQQQLVVQTRKTLAGVELDSGDILWKHDIPAFRGMNILTPTVIDNSVFASTYGGGSRLIDVTKADTKYAAEEKWKNPAQGYMSTPVVIDGHAFLHMRNQRLTCFDLRSGERKWTTEERFGKYMSLVTDGKQILALDERGILYLLAANPVRFELVDSTQVSEHPSWAHLAVCGDKLFVRDLAGLTVLRWADRDPKRHTSD